MKMFKKQNRHIAAELLLFALAAVLFYILFQFFGNRSHTKTEGYSLFNWIISQWMSSGGDFSHGWIMPLISAGVIWSKRKDLSLARSGYSYAGLLVLLLSLAVHWAALRAQQPRVSLVAMVGVLWGIPYFLYGRSVAKLLLFPCGYLFLCFTSYLFVSITLPLRLIASALSAGILNGLGITAIRNGTAIYSAAGGGFNFDVADPCSGLRSLVVMTALTAPYAYFTQKTTFKCWTLFLLSVPLAMMANTTRIVTIALIAQTFGQDKAMALYHDYSGYLVFAVATFLMVSAGAMLNVNYKEILIKWKNDHINRT